MSIHYQKGSYRARIIDVALDESKNGFPQVIVRGTLICGLDAGRNEFDCEQYDRTVYLTVTDKTTEYILKKLRNAGWKSDRFEQINELVGLDAVFVCDHEKQTEGKYAGQMGEKWDLELPRKASEPLENKPAVAKKMNALFGKMLKEGAAPKSAPAAEQRETVPANAATEDAGDGEVPFDLF